MKRIPAVVFAACFFPGAGFALGQGQTRVEPPVATVYSSGVVVQAGEIAQVAYTNGLLEVSADNSSLNQILREISRKTGLKITGSVQDERVYGKYGPSTLARMLAELLDGTGSNMLLREGAPGMQAELVLTPRTGGPSLPQPPGAEASASSASAAATPPVVAPTWMPVQAPGSLPAPASPAEQYQRQQETMQRLQQQQQQLLQQQQRQAGH